MFSSINLPERGFSLHVNITIDPSNVDAFLAAFRPVYEAVVAEPDCSFFEVFYSLDEPGVFRFVENWNKSREWFLENQLTKEYYKPYLDITEPMWIKPRTFNFFGRSSKEWTTVKEGNF
ncbi:antibiotic biosynthesis monooxygenase domain-containing protein [Pochonia chlamydosporia 170]|uniref:Antibiotic biosynthesis monooxygenase domain-containing protein n=1 Tax=Pochonia chlamydosporia 170 TaxID=1380566 RepID=A0A179F540_METCM|nr:antibiotic biosynthesis monooxygenase domain-containing protein [Pochonia chlamydosporia 170]OAQ60544.1 antibiotic biosynthesis monooxygenase domain-containing protein [Pochonia chlamydosporia 170]